MEEKIDYTSLIIECFKNRLLFLKNTSTIENPKHEIVLENLIKISISHKLWGFFTEKSFKEIEERMKSFDQVVFRDFLFDVSSIIQYQLLSKEINISTITDVVTDSFCYDKTFANPITSDQILTSERFVKKDNVKQLVEENVYLAFLYVFLINTFDFNFLRIQSHE